MPRYEDHIKQVNSNLQFLQKINQNAPDHLDWQVTVCFYSALHLVNAHLATLNLQYRNHTDVRDIINPYNKLSLGKLPEDEFVSYDSLFSNSRRARYLVNHNDNNLMSDVGSFTYDKHLAKSIRHLETMIRYFDAKYTLDLPIIQIKCAQLRNQNEFKYFKLLF